MRILAFKASLNSLWYLSSGGVFPSSSASFKYISASCIPQGPEVWALESSLQLVL